MAGLDTGKGLRVRPTGSRSILAHAHRHAQGTGHSKASNPWPTDPSPYIICHKIVVLKSTPVTDPFDFFHRRPRTTRGEICLVGLCRLGYTSENEKDLVAHGGDQLLTVLMKSKGHVAAMLSSTQVLVVEGRRRISAVLLPGCQQIGSESTPVVANDDERLVPGDGVNERG
ncbi:hypothetical protein GW17_00028276 [Ensete ventricosum]|nr:hypothetical protein GW17_00028276 [Ensete ventricosum]